MPSIVMKFGGSSVADADAVERVVAAVEAERAASRTPVVVVSALGGMTDALLGLTRHGGAGDAPEIREAASELIARHISLGQALGLPAADAERALDPFPRELRQRLEAICRARTADDASVDAIVALGEMMSSRLIAAVLLARGLDAAWVDAREVVMTDARHTCAAPLDETNGACVKVLAPLLAAAGIPVLGGFVGRAPDGSTTTLGRGGSDYSASLVGAAIGASEIQIWTDVDGMLNADPRIVYDAQVVSHLSFAEASELAYFGAKVLHPSTIFPAVARSIPVRIRNSRRPEASGTLITADPPRGNRPFAALACKRGITVIDITSTRMLMAHGFLRRVFEAFETNETAVDVVTTSEVSVSVTIDDNRRGPEIVAALLEFADVTVEEQMAILTVVGERLATNSTLAARIVGAMTGFPLRMISQAASRRNLTIVLPEASLAPAMMHLHRELFAIAEPAR